MKIFLDAAQKTICRYILDRFIEKKEALSKKNIPAPAVPQFAVSHESGLMMCLMTCCKLCFGLPFRQVG